MKSWSNKLHLESLIILDLTFDYYIRKRHGFKINLDMNARHSFHEAEFLLFFFFFNFFEDTGWGHWMIYTPVFLLATYNQVESFEILNWS